MCKNNMMLEFLIFSYFGITIDKAENFDAALEASINRAYRDASSHVLSIKNSKENENEKTPREVGSEIIFDTIKGLTDNQKEYDDVHTTLCCKLVEQYDNKDYYKCYPERTFTYGIAQKWVNMTMKYIYMFHLIFNFREFVDVTKEYEKYFHIPLDRYVFKELKKEFGIKAEENFDKGAWSKIRMEEREKYNDLQEKIREKIPEAQSPLEWEHNAWIKSKRE